MSLSGLSGFEETRECLEELCDEGRNRGLDDFALVALLRLRYVEIVAESPVLDVAEVDRILDNILFASSLEGAEDLEDEEIDEILEIILDGGEP